MLKRHYRCVSFAVFSLMWSGGCSQSVYDFPVATMIGPERGYSMTGYAGTADEAIAREKVMKRLEGVCPDGAVIRDFKVVRADAAIGTKVLRYEALATCKSF